MLAILAFVFICVRASSALVRTSAFLQPVVRGQVYIFEISPPLGGTYLKWQNMSEKCTVDVKKWTVFKKSTRDMFLLQKKNWLIQLNFVKANFIKTNNSLGRSKISVPNRVLLILTKIQLVKSKYPCRTFYVLKHIFRSRSGVFFIKSIG